MTGTRDKIEILSMERWDELFEQSVGVARWKNA
jgi:hypothetical protein